MQASRRSFLGGALALGAITALPKGVLAETLPVLHGDGIHDDTAALQALFDGKPFRTVDGFAGTAQSGLLRGGSFRISDTLTARENFVIEGCVIDTCDVPDGRVFLNASGADIAITNNRFYVSPVRFAMGESNALSN